MIRKILQDVLPPEKKSIRHIPLPGGRKPIVMERVKEESESTEEPKQRPARRKRNFNLSRWSLSIGAVFLLIAVFVGLSWYFAYATVTIKPKQATAAVDTNIDADIKTDAPLAYTLITATSTASEAITTSREADVQRKASGQIVVYNNYSSENQRLIKNTRFESANGHIYRIDSSIVVPGQSVNGGKKVPGSATVTVYADVAGPEYNLPLSELKGDFTIPGFKTSPRFQAFYARQKTDIAGGFSGRARVVDDSALNEVEKRLRTQLEQETWNSLSSALPKEYILFKTLYTTEFSVSTKDNPNGDGVLVEVTAFGKAAAFNKINLSSFLASKALTWYDKKEPVVIANFDVITFTLINPVSESMSGKGALALQVKGNAQFVWQFDQNNLKKALAGRYKSDTDTIMRNYTAIGKATVVIKPSWRSKYPTNINRIDVELKLD